MSRQEEILAQLAAEKGARKAADALIAASVEYWKAEARFEVSGPVPRYRKNSKRWRDVVGAAYWRVQCAMRELDDECRKLAGREPLPAREDRKS